MEPMTPKRKPWPLKKRLKVGGLYGGIILVSALVIGTMLYGILRLTGLIVPFDIVKAVSEEVRQNPYLMSLWQHEASKNECINYYKKFAYSADTSLRITPVSQDEEACGEITWKEAGGNVGYIKIVVDDDMAAEEVVSSYVSGMDEVVTDIYGHPLVRGTHMYGKMNDMMVRVIVLPMKSSTVLSVVIYPAQSTLNRSQLDVIDSLRLID